MFSAVISSALTQTTQLLKDDPQATTEKLLKSILHTMNQTSVDAGDVTSTFKPPKKAVVVNILFFLSLGTSLVGAVVAIIAKQWVRRYNLGLDGISSSRLRARERHVRWDGLSGWHLYDLVSWIPIILHAAFILFFLGLALWLPLLYTSLFPIGIIMAAIKLIGYIIVALFPTPLTSTSFGWWFSRAIFHWFFQNLNQEPPLELYSTLPDTAVRQDYGYEGVRDGLKLGYCSTKWISRYSLRLKQGL